MSLLQSFLAPIFLHVLLVIVVGIRTASARINSVRSGETRMKDIALDASKWPPQVRKLGNNFDNQFDVPMMWYGLSALVVATAKIDAALVVLAWIFIATRAVHAYIHTTSNKILYRMFAYHAGMMALLAMWIWFGLRLFVIG